MLFREFKRDEVSLLKFFPLSFEGVETIKESQSEVKPLLHNSFPLSFEGERC